jgi:hypothetical protein
LVLQWCMNSTGSRQSLVPEQHDRVVAFLADVPA